MRTSLGKLLWSSTQTQPGLSFGTCTMASKIRTSKKSDLAVLIKLIGKCKAMPAKLCFQTLDVENWVIILCTDDSLGNC